MDQLRSYADGRLIDGCIYCGGLADTRDHVPSRTLLNKPYPENLPVVGACFACNNGFSGDEEYVVCLIESVIAGSTDPNDIKRPSVASTLLRSPALRARIEASKTVVDGQVQFKVEEERMKNVLLKLARGHVAFELNLPCRNEPDRWWFTPMLLLSKEQFDSFDDAHYPETIGEVGSRAVQRLMVIQTNLFSDKSSDLMSGFLMNDWVEVQNGIYRYLAFHQGTQIVVKIVMGEYLSCEVRWNL